MFKDWYKSRLNSGKTEKKEVIPAVTVTPLLSQINKTLELAKAMKEQEAATLASDHSPSQASQIDHSYHKINSKPFEEFEKATADKMPMTSLDASKGASIKVKHKVNKDTYMSRVYHADASHAGRSIPLSGWGMMTTKNLYKEAGIPHLCEDVQMSSIKHNGEEIPTVVSKFSSYKNKATDLAPKSKRSSDEDTSKLSQEELYASVLDNKYSINPVHARQIGLMDYLTGNYDRHGDNVLIDDKIDKNGHKSLLAIDHDRSFNYTEDKNSDPHEHFRRSALHRLLKIDAAMDHSEDHDGALVDWWHDKKVGIHDEMRRSLEMIKDHKLRAHVNSNFKTRYNLIDSWANSYNQSPRSLFQSDESARHIPVTPLHAVDPNYVKLIDRELPSNPDNKFSLLLSEIRDTEDSDKKETLMHMARSTSHDMSIDAIVKFLSKYDSNPDIVAIKKKMADLSLSNIPKALAIIQAHENMPKDNRFLSDFYVDRVKQQIKKGQ